MAEEAVVIESAAGEVQVNPEEARARELGWKPQEEYTGPEGKWVDAHEFVSRQPLFEKIDSLKSELWKTKQEHQQEFAQIRKHFDSVKETEFKRALDFLKAQKVEAVSNGDAATVLEIDEKIDTLKDQRANEKVQTAPKATGPDPAFVEWIESNSWYTQDNELREDADAFAFQYVTKNPSAPISEVLSHVDKRMKQIIKPEPKASAAAVESNSNTTTAIRGKKKFSEADMSSDEKSVMNTLVARKVLTKEQYMDQLAEAKGLK